MHADVTRPSADRASSGRSHDRTVVLLALAGLLAILAYSLIYPWRGFAVPIGFDTPVYLWSADHAAAFGLDAPGLLARPGALATVASLLELMPVDDLTAIAAVQVAVIVVTALASAVLAAAAFGARVVSMALVTLLVALFLTPLGDGFLSSSMFVATFTAGLAVLLLVPDGTGPSILAGVLFAAGGLAHPVFATIGLPIVSGVLLAIVLRRRRLPSWRRTMGGVVLALAIGVGVTLLTVLLRGPGSVPLDTSADAALRRIGAVSATVIFRRHQLEAELPAFLFLLLAAALVVDRLVRRPDPSARTGTRATAFWGASAAWVAVTGAGVLALAAGRPVPAHRLLWVCLPLPIVVGAAATRMFDANGVPPAGRWWRLARIATPIVVLGIFASAHALQWRRVEPTITAPEASFLARLGTGLERTPARTPVILLTGDNVAPTEMIDELNWLRAATAAARLHDLHVFPGGPGDLLGDGPEPIGARFHDELVADYATRARSAVRAGSVVAASAPIDRDATDEAAGVQGARAFGEDAVLLPAPADDRAVPIPYPHEPVTLLAPWLVPLSTPLLLAGLGLIGIGWVRWSTPARRLPERLALAPGVGLAALMLASVLVDTAGLRLGSGGWLAATLVALVPGAWLGGRAAWAARLRAGTMSDDATIDGSLRVGSSDRTRGGEGTG